MKKGPLVSGSLEGFILYLMSDSQGEVGSLLGCAPSFELVATHNARTADCCGNNNNHIIIWF